ncbi:abortive phage infection protein, partial [Acinetobacter baumannii]|nr:abortive phage infection protein [Acinetobacter baumannii]
MSEIGMTFEPQICRYHANIPPMGILRLSGYAISEELDQLDLYVTEYSGDNELENIPDSEIKSAAER